MGAEFLPQHLRKYVVTQNYEKYTPVDQAVWRYVLRQLKAFLSVHAHPCYVEGLEKTGIEIERIPHIEQISAKLEKFGWRAMPVSGFIPPAAFMELQSLGVLPVASDMRTLDHLLYTPAPDIVHEAAGHAPILIHPEFAEYLRQYAQVAKKAIISKEDLDLYEAIRELSDVKENPVSTAADIEKAEKNLERVSKNSTHVSEATELSRMNWWTAEYGLIGDLKNPKLFGAGLLSSVGEAKFCLSEKVKKIPLSIDCIKTTYDITEPQPQLFVTPDFPTLTKVLEEMAAQMAYRVGGIAGIRKAIEAKSVNTMQLNSGLQISGVIAEPILGGDKKIAYIKTQGPTQISFADKQLKGHGQDYHAQGFGSPIGGLKAYPGRCPSTLTNSEWEKLGVKKNANVKLEFSSGVVVTGTLKNLWERDGASLILTFENAKAEFQGQILFDPSWGMYDIVMGLEVNSVFGGAADRLSFGETDDFVAKRVPATVYSENELKRHRHYQSLRELREKNESAEAVETGLSEILRQHEAFPDDWLLRLEAYELITSKNPRSTLRLRIEKDLQTIGQQSEKIASLIKDGLRLADRP